MTFYEIHSNSLAIFGHFNILVDVFTVIGTCFVIFTGKIIFLFHVLLHYRYFSPRDILLSTFLFGWKDNIH